MNLKITNLPKSLGISVMRPCSLRTVAVFAVAFATPLSLPPPSHATPRLLGYGKR